MSLSYPKNLTEEDTDDILRGFNFPTTPMHHQAISIIWAMESEGRVAFFHDVGTGKSLTSLYTHWLWDFERLLIVCPNSVVESWEEQISKHTTFDCCLLKGPAEYRKKLLRQSKAAIFILNYEGLQVLFGDRVKRGKRTKNVLNRQKVKDANIDALIFDECHALKSETSLISRISAELSRQASNAIIMTGTPYGTGDEDFWSQFYVLDGGYTLGGSKKKFLQRHFTFDWWGSPHIKPGHREQILERIAPVTLRYDRLECFDLPDRTYEVRQVDMTKEQRGLTDDLIAGKTVWHENECLEMLDPMIVGNKLAQVTGGFLKFNPSVMRLKKNPKLDLLVDLLVYEVRGKVIVFHAYVEEGRMIEERLSEIGIGHVSMRGETSKDGWKQFKAEKACRVLVAHPASGGVGLNLQEASTAIFFSNGCSGATVREQAEGRIWRLGQERPCLYIDILARGSIDEQRLDRVEERADIATKILNYLSGA